MHWASLLSDAEKGEAMKVFISSVRRGLESERDYLPDLILANGHEPLRFEDFGAQDLTSRGACLGGVQQADVYLLVLGPHYGAEMSDSGISATEEEFNTATTRGIPVYVFKKRGVEADTEQQAFMARVGSYQEGRFWAEFVDNAELGVAVTRALQQHQIPAAPFAQVSLSRQIQPTWRRDLPSLATPRDHVAVLEVHVDPVEQTTLRPVAALGDLATTLAADARQQGFFGHGDALNIGSDVDSAWCVRADGDTQRSWNERSESPYAGVFTHRDGALGVFQALPRDTLGTLVDEQDLTQRITVLLRHLVPYLPAVEHIAVSAAIDPAEWVSIGDPSSVGHRSSGSMGFNRHTAVQAPPVDQVATRSLPQHLHEAARDLAARLVQELRGR